MSLKIPHRRRALQLFAGPMASGVVKLVHVPGLLAFRRKCVRAVQAQAKAIPQTQTGSYPPTNKDATGSSSHDTEQEVKK